MNAPRDAPSASALELVSKLATPVWVFDLSLARIVWANQAAVQFWAARNREELLERDFNVYLDLATVERLRGYQQRLLVEARVSEQWTFYPFDQPLTLTCSFSTFPSSGEGPAFLVEAAPAGALGVERDTLRNVEAVRHTTALISLIDIEGPLLMENPAAIRVYGSMTGLPESDHAFSRRFVDPDDSARALHRVRSGKEFVEEVWVRALDGSRRHAIEARSTMDPVSGRNAILLSEIDVTFRYEAEEVVRRVYSELESRVRERTLDLERLNRELGEERQFVSAVLETVGSLLLVTDGYGDIVRVNRALCELSGYEAEELVGQPIWKMMIPPESELVERAFAEHGPRFHTVMPKTVEGALRMKSGETRSVSWTNTALLDQHGLSEYLIGAGLDTTDRKEIELRLQISDRMASIGTLAAGVAHGINNPLAYVIANLDYLRAKLSRPWDELEATEVAELRDLLDESLEGADRVRRIVGDLRSFSRLGDDRVQRVDLSVVIERALNMATNEIRHRARVVLEISQVPPVVGTESKLGQVVLNLLVNAAQAIEPGAVEKNSITVRVFMDRHRRPRLEIEDTGVGIPPEYQRRVFDPFFTTKPVGIGTGLGLSIAHRIVSEFGGEIGIESRHQQGTLAWVALEAAPSVVPAHSHSHGNASLPPPSERIRTARILIVDDEPAILRALSRVLSGYQVTRALSGREALQKIEEEGPFDVVFCDVMMPELSGIDVYERARRICPGQERRLVFITGGAFTEQTSAFLDATQNPKLGKPFDSGEVRALVKSMTREGVPEA